MEAIEKWRSENIYPHLTCEEEYKERGQLANNKAGYCHNYAGHLWVTDEIVFLIIKMKVTSYSYTIIMCQVICYTLQNIVEEIPAIAIIA